MLKPKIKKEMLWIFATAAALLPLYAFLYKVYAAHTNSFGCFDECLNFGAGYFMTKGQVLYSQIFFNHQPLAAYLSLIVQTVTHPINLYEFLLRHHQFLLIFSFIFSVVIIRTFKFAGLFFVIIFETTKFYIFGDRFLAESFIVYPFAYLSGLLFNKINEKQLTKVETFRSGIFTWFIVFMREPFVPAAIFLYALLIGRPTTKIKQISLGVFGLLSILTVLIQPLRMYFYTLFTLNYNAFFAHSGSRHLSINFLEIPFYPLFVFFKGPMNEFKIILIGLSLVFCLSFLYLAFIKKYKLLVVVLTLLALANLRVVEPGTIFYAAFHIIPWYGIFILLSFLMVELIRKTNQKIAFGLYAVIFVSFVFYLIQPANFLRQKTDRELEFHIAYSKTYAVGETVKALSNKNQTFFIDKEDDVNLAYWIADLKPAYKYSWYAYVEPGPAIFEDAKTEMFEKYPPDFYYGNSSLAVIKDEYVKLKTPDKSANLWVKKSILSGITSEQWEKASELHFQKP